MKRLLLIFSGVMFLLLPAMAATVTFSSTNKPATWAKLKAAVGTVPIESGASVDSGTVVVFTADEGIGYHVDWYVNDVLDSVSYHSTHNTLLLTITGDTKVEARYVEHFKYVFKGTPFVKYANAKGEIYVGCNAYYHRGDKARAFGYSLMTFNRSDTTAVERPDNVPYDTLYIKKDTLTADVVMTPNWTLSESDLGDVTATVTWDFTHPDSIGLFRNYQGRCDYPSPTFMESVYTDVNMSIDATNGWIDNEHRLKVRDTQVGAGTRLKIPARYGTLYQIVTRGELQSTTIADSTTYRKSVDADGNHVATLLYYESDYDSIYINVKEDIELLKVSASYPGGDNILAWEPEMKTTRNELVTASKTGEAGCLLFNMSDITLNGGLKVEAGEPLDSLSAMIEVPDAFDADKYLSVTFQTGEGFSFSMKQVFLQMRLVGADKSADVRMTLTDELGNKLDTIYHYHQADSILLDTLCNLGKPNDIAFVGKMTLKVYVYGKADSYRLCMPFTCAGEICEIIRFPEGYNFIPYKAKSEIDKDGTALLTIDCFELVGVDEEEQHVILNAIEEVPMGDFLIIHSDSAGATHHIPLTRADDAYVRGNNKLWMSDGTVRGGKDIYCFSKENIDGERYLFRNTPPDSIIPRGVIYLKYHSASRADLFYLDKDDMPVKIEQLVLGATDDNNQTIIDYKARTIKQVVLGGRTFTKNHAWNTLCLPFDVLAENLDASPLSGAEIWELDVTSKADYTEPTGFNPVTGVLTLNFKPARSIEPGKPYLFEWRTTQPSLIENPVFGNVTIKTSEPDEMCVTSSDGRVQFVGTYAPSLLLAGSGGNLYMDAADNLQIPQANMDINAFQAYFRIDVGNGLGMPGPDAISSGVMNIDGGIVTTVFNLKQDAPAATSGWHTLDGRKLTRRPTTKGVYMHGDRKVIVD